MEDVHISACEHHLATCAHALQGFYFMWMERHVTHLHQSTYFLQHGTHWPGYHLIPLNCGMSPCPYQMCIMPLQLISTGEIIKCTIQTHFLISSGMVMNYEFKLNFFTSCVCNYYLPLPAPPPPNANFWNMICICMNLSTSIMSVLTLCFQPPTTSIWWSCKLLRCSRQIF